MPDEKLVMLVANRTATAEPLIEAVRERAARDDEVRFHLVVPARPHGLHRVVDPEVAGREEASAQLEAARALLREAAGAPVTGEVGSADPVAAIHDALARERFDEIIVSTLPRRMSKWLRVDLPSKARGFGLPVTHVEARSTASPVISADAGPVAGEVMSRILVTVAPGDTLREAARRMSAENVGAAVVLREGGLPGIITERDVLRSVAGAENLDEQPVSAHATFEVICAKEDTPLRSAAEEMVAGGFRHVIVLGPGDEPAGIISMRDAVRVWLDESAAGAAGSRDAAA